MKNFITNAFLAKRKNVPTDIAKAIYISTYTPRMCGIATFTDDLTSAICKVNSSYKPQIIALTDTDKKYDYGEEVVLEISQGRLSDYKRAAYYINNSEAEVVNLQHEFGIFGGNDGEYVLEMLRLINKPIVTCLHTILPNSGERKSKILEEIMNLSTTVIAMSKSSKQVLLDQYELPKDKVQIIHHGVPVFSIKPPRIFRKKMGIKATPMIMVSGLIGPGKGFEHAIEAMVKVSWHYPESKLYVVGRVHPSAAGDKSINYMTNLKNLVTKLGISKNVVFVDKFLSLDKLIEYFQATDFYITPHLDKKQPTSGTLAKAIGAGKVCISTPFSYATEMLSGGSGILVDYSSPDQIANAIIKTLSHPVRMQTYRTKAYLRGIDMHWPNVATKYSILFDGLLADESYSKTTGVLEKQAASLVEPV
jgi:polysaccharide biosynthesis protein PslF